MSQICSKTASDPAGTVSQSCTRATFRFLAQGPLTHARYCSVLGRGMLRRKPGARPLHRKWGRATKASESALLWARIPSRASGSCGVACIWDCLRRDWQPWAPVRPLHGHPRTHSLSASDHPKFRSRELKGAPERSLKVPPPSSGSAIRLQRGLLRRFPGAGFVAPPLP